MLTAKFHPSVPTPFLHVPCQGSSAETLHVGPRPSERPSRGSPRLVPARARAFRTPWRGSDQILEDGADSERFMLQGGVALEVCGAVGISHLFGGHPHFSLHPLYFLTLCTASAAVGTCHSIPTWTPSSPLPPQPRYITYITAGC